MTTFKVYTRPGFSPSKFGESMQGDGTTWRDAVERANSDGTGIVFLDCSNYDHVKYIIEQLEDAAEVDSYVEMPF